MLNTGNVYAHTTSLESLESLLPKLGHYKNHVVVDCKEYAQKSVLEQYKASVALGETKEFIYIFANVNEISPVDLDMLIKRLPQHSHVKLYLQSQNGFSNHAEFVDKCIVVPA